MSKSALSERDKKRIREADPNEGRCLVTNGDSCFVQYCHCIPRKKCLKEEGKMLDNLEWAWNMKRFSLNLDTRYNVFFAEAKHHISFDQEEWLLMPEEDIIEKYYKSLIHIIGFFFKADRKKFPDFPEKNIFRYKFVPLPGSLQHMPSISRLDANTSHSIHSHPFNTLPVLESHLHPKFVIFNAGRKLDRLDITSFKKVFDAFPFIHKICILYRAWAPPTREGLPAITYKDPSYWVPDDDFGSDDEDDNDGDDPNDADDIGTNKTGSGRGGRWVRRNKQKAPAKGKRKRKVLSKMALSILNEQLGDAAWTDDRIREWSKASSVRRRRKVCQ